MNKSKFLKKSLAMLLALMLVVAMIPLSASAAEGPKVTEVTVDGVAASGSDTSYSATIVEPTDAVKVTVEIESAAGTVAHYTDGTLLNSNNAKLEGEVYAFTLTEEEMIAEEFTFDVLQGGKVVETYTVSYDTVPASADTSLKTVYLDGQYDCWNNIDSNKETDYTVVAPYGLTLDEDKTFVEITPNYVGATVTGKNGSALEQNAKGAYLLPVGEYDKAVEFSVNAANDAQENYTVTVVKPIPFESFAIENERHDSQIERVTEDPQWQVSAGNGEPRVEVYLPYDAKTDANNDFYFTPEFTTNYDVTVYIYKNQTRTEANAVELVSGETYNLKDFDPSWRENAGDKVGDKRVYMTVNYSDDKVENWELTFDRNEDGDTIPAIKGLTVKNYVAEIEGTTITLTIPQSVRNDATELDFVMSAGTRIDLVDTTSKNCFAINKNSDAGKAMTVPAKTLAAKDRYTLRVTAAAAEFDAEGVKAVQDYTLNIVTAEVQDPELNRVTLKSEKTGETLEGRIEGAYVYFDGDNAIPYRYKSVKAMADDEWQLFWSVSSGTTVTYNTTADEGTNLVDFTGSVVDDNMPYLPDSKSRFDKTVASQFIVVANDTSSQGYKIVFTSAPASQNSTLGDVTLAMNDVEKFEDLNDQNQTKAVVNNIEDTISAEIWYKEWAEYNNTSAPSAPNHGGAAIVTTLPAGAKMYFKGWNDDTLTPLDALNENNDEVTYYLPAVGVYNSYYYGNTYDSKTDDHPDALKLIVVSEALADKVYDTTTYAQLTKAANEPFYTEYDLTLTQKAPRTGNNLTSLSVYDNYTDTMIDAKLVGNTFTITLPYYFTDANRHSLDNLYLDFAPEQGGQTVTAYSNGIEDDVVLNDLAMKEDGTLDTTKSVKLQWNKGTDDHTNAFKVTDGIDEGWIGYKEYKENGKNYGLVVTAENGNTKENVYNVVINVAAPEEEAELNSVTIAGSTATPNSKNEVTVTVPYNTEVTNLAPVFNVSENAYVIEGGPENIGSGDKLKYIVDEGEAYNFLTPRTFTVVSEDGAARETYTITVVASDEFVDVQPDDWFYEYVMTAAGKGWVAGEGNGVFNPNGTLKRGDFALMIARILGYDEASYSKTAFPDVASDKYYSAAVAFCKENNIIDGDDKGNFNGEDAITREQMAKILCQALQLKVTIPEKTYDDDAKIAGWAKDYVYACQEAGVMEGDNGSFRPKDNATRAEAATVLVRAFA